jgi:pimeloyl-ACP methyl ester carboxylesterase
VKGKNFKQYGTIVETKYGDFFIRKVGNGEPTIWIEPALGGLSAEWWSIQDILGQEKTVITYDRLGYGWSSLPKNRKRTPLNVADEMAVLMEKLGIEKPVVFIGHSQGGLYVRSFLKTRKDLVAGILFLDPLSPFDKNASEKLKPEVYRKSGFDKTQQMKSMKFLAKLRIMPLLKPLVLKLPPFYYYTNVSNEAKEIIFQSIRRSSFYSTIIEEYEESHKDANLVGIDNMRGFFGGPTVVLYHDPEVIKREIVEYGGLEEVDAQLVDDVWKVLVREYCELSIYSEFKEIDRASHYIHMSNPDIVISIVKDLLKNAIHGK